MTAPHSSFEKTVQLAKSISKGLSSRYPLLSSDRRVGASIGIAICEEGSQPESVLREADLALYRAKRDGRNCFRFFEAAMDKEVRDRGKLESDLRAAIENGQIEPYYQPIINLKDQTVVAFGILSRWSRDSANVIEPSVFIPLAEDMGLMDDLTFAVLRQACKDAQQWPDQISLSLNISGANSKPEPTISHSRSAQ